MSPKPFPITALSSTFFIKILCFVHLEVYETEYFNDYVISAQTLVM